MNEIISGAAVVFDYGLDSVATVANTIVGTPLLLFATVCGIAFVGVTLFKRLISVNL